MNLDKLFAWITGIVVAFALTGQLDLLQHWIWRAQAKVIHESRASTWGSPRFWSTTPTQNQKSKLKNVNNRSAATGSDHNNQ